jgi:hypothetical protein
MEDVEEPSYLFHWIQQSEWMNAPDSWMNTLGFPTTRILGRFWAEQEILFLLANVHPFFGQNRPIYFIGPVLICPFALK